MESEEGSRNLTQRLTYELGQAIVQGRYPENAVFPTEAELSSQFHISRSVTREAVKMLTAKGLISSRPRKGIQVQSPKSWNMFDEDVLNWTLSEKPTMALIREFTQLRAAIEPEAVALAATYANSAQRDGLLEALQHLQKQVSAGEDELPARVDLHMRILEASRNRFFVQFSGFIYAALRVNASCSSSFQQRLRTGTEDYQLLVDAIVNRCPEVGRDFYYDHLQKQLSRLDELNSETAIDLQEELEPIP